MRDYAGALFDVILVDGPDPVGPAEGLFQSPFYQSCKQRLAPDGVLASQTEAPFVMHESFVRIVKTLGNVFAACTRIRPGADLSVWQLELVVRLQYRRARCAAPRRLAQIEAGVATTTAISTAPPSRSRTTSARPWCKRRSASYTGAMSGYVWHPSPSGRTELIERQRHPPDA